MSVMLYFISIGGTAVARRLLQTTRTDVPAVLLCFHNKGQHSQGRQRKRNVIHLARCQLGYSNVLAGRSVVATTMPAVSCKKTTQNLYNYLPFDSCSETVDWRFRFIEMVVRVAT